ncbi:hypothetical protein EYF80_018962 [Liparis tanakae]|uniref:Uncharacterized protein n=1 Tax=Liparis tanakae TaxID=230148 RepID=A0A4Z2HYT8_9TELE|nr:hypothetical protein EYF80_018962 [Liparis tanakae]
MAALDSLIQEHHLSSLKGAACVTVAHRWCNVRPSSPDGSHTCPPGRLRGRCSVGDSPSARSLVPSSLPRSDTRR